MCRSLTDTWGEEEVRELCKQCGGFVKTLYSEAIGLVGGENDLCVFAFTCGAWAPILVWAARRQCQIFSVDKNL